MNDRQRGRTEGLGAGAAFMAIVDVSLWALDIRPDWPHGPIAWFCLVAFVIWAEAWTRPTLDGSK